MLGFTGLIGSLWIVDEQRLKVMSMAGAERVYSPRPFQELVHFRSEKFVVVQS